MLADKPIIAFVATARPEEARAFYTDVLGLKLISEDQYALAFEAGGTMLRVAKVDTLDPPGYTVLGWIVPDIQSAVSQLASRGVEFNRYPWMAEQDSLGIWAAPGGAQVAWFKDPDGNTLSVTQLTR
jgi:catechol 2,3-dioxygenase-like lactoylglutathione lyase family enzyme